MTNKIIVFDNEGRTSDRLTVINRETGDVFAVGLNPNGVATNCKFCGNCADHRITLYGSGWRQMPLTRRIIETETESYVCNAQLNPGWLGKELLQVQWPLNLSEIIENQDKQQTKSLNSPQNLNTKSA
ncbi:MAG TPA: hypothetical protein VKR32_20175 [Puia sp.]|nr:hypothetical protein [Puia sp.]